MANLKIRIEQEIGESEAMIVVTVTNDVGVEAIINQMKEMFEVEMLSAKIVNGTVKSSITIFTNNEVKINKVRTGIKKMFRDCSGLNRFNYN